MGFRRLYMPVKADNLWIRRQAVSEGAKCMANYMYIKQQSVAKTSMSGAKLFCKICL